MSNSLPPYMIPVVQLTTDKLSNDELAAIYMAAMAGFINPAIAGYDKAKPLFTECDGTKMHSDTLRALEAIVRQRIG